MTHSDAHTEEIRAQFTRQALAYAESDQAKDMRAMARLAKIAEVKADSNVLDVACGPGRLTMAFAATARSVVGIDATQALLAIASSEAAARDLKNIEFQQATALALPFGASECDTVSCRAAFHHFADPTQVLREMVRVTKPGGQILIADILGNANTQCGQAHDKLERLCDPTHVRCVPSTEFERMFDAVGLTTKLASHGSIDYEVTSWIAHGGPSEDVESKIRTIFEHELLHDQTGLNVRRGHSELMFTHNTVVYLLQK